MGGMRIDDHRSWIGQGKKGVVFPDGAKMKSESDAMSDGHLNKYEDTTEAIKAQQDMGERKAKGHDMKPGYRY